MTVSAVKAYWGKLAADGCILCGGPAEIAHCHGGSIVERMGEPKAKGKKLARYHWLVLPLCYRHHRVGRGSLDDNVAHWEAAWGTQAEWIDMLCSRFGVDLWAKAREGRK